MLAYVTMPRKVTYQWWVDGQSNRGPVGRVSHFSTTVKGTCGKSVFKEDIVWDILQNKA